MSFLKKFTRSSRSNSYVDDDEDYDYEADELPRDRAVDPAGPTAPPSSFRVTNQYNQAPSPTAAHFEGSKDVGRGYPVVPQPSPRDSRVQPQERQDMSYHSSNRSSGIAPVPPPNGMSTSRDGFVEVPSMSKPHSQPQLQQPPSPSQGLASPTKVEAAPDLLTRAFNEAVRPFSDKIEQLEQRVQDMQALVDQLEQQRLDIFNWIDKRGLRPDVPTDIAKQMDLSSDAANALNAQLDRKITIVNFDLHRLQDDLNDSISSAHFASAMAKFLPDIQRLTDLHQGPRYAYELVIKLVGNLNSHGGLEANRDLSDDQEVEEDRRARQDFYERMDEEMVGIVARRGQDGEDWVISREIKRLEKNAAYLKNLGIEPYFPRALDAMRQQMNNFGGRQPSPQRYGDTGVGAPGARQSMQK